MKNWENLPQGTIDKIQNLIALNMQTTGQATQCFLIAIMSIFSFGLFAQTPLVIPLSEMTLVVTPIKVGGSAMLNGELLNPEKPLITDSTYTCIWTVGETILTMEFDRNCKKCPASPIWYKQGDTVRVWINSDDGKTWNELLPSLPTLLTLNSKLINFKK